MPDPDPPAAGPAALGLTASVLLDEGSGELRGHNRDRAEQRFSPASTFMIANSLIGVSLGE